MAQTRRNLGPVLTAGKDLCFDVGTGLPLEGDVREVLGSLSEGFLIVPFGPGNEVGGVAVSGSPFAS